MNVLLSFVGFHDPFADTGLDDEREAGPVLTVISERNFDVVVLFATPTLSDRIDATVKAISERHPAVRVELAEIAIKDPTNYIGLLRQIRIAWSAIRKRYPDAEFTISVSSGTPHMHASWLLLAASGEIPATLVQSKASKYVISGNRRVSEIDFTGQDFPQVRSISLPTEEGRAPSDAMAVAASMGILGEHELHAVAIRKAVILGEYDEHVLVTGETGTGKEMIAKLIHQVSKRAQGPFICVNCAGFSENLVESQLFGHRRGAFTGADRDHIGYFEAARGGVLFLDEIGELPLTSQAKLLRALEQRTIQRVGDSQELKINVRVVAATNREVKKAVRDGIFREDLYYRFGEVIHLVSLRERKSDITKIALHVLDQWNGTYAKQKRLSADAIKRLMKHDWPGNIRELRKMVERSARLSQGKIIQATDLIFEDSFFPKGFESLPEPHHGFDLNDYCAEVRRRLVDRAIFLGQGNKSEAARLLGVTPQAVHLFLKGQKDKA